MASNPPWLPHGIPQQQQQQQHPLPVPSAAANLGYDPYATAINFDSRETRETSSSDTRHPPPLKRGDACLYCRRRRIRCSATKPQCHHCAKLKRECVYDVGKPVSRVRKLEDKVAELEGYLRQANAAVAQASSNAALAAHAQSGLQPMDVGSYSQHSTTPELGQDGHDYHSHVGSQSSYSYATGSLDQSTVDITMMDNFQVAPGMPNMASRIGVNMPPTMQHRSSYDWDTLDSSYMGLVSQMSETALPGGPGPYEEQKPHVNHVASASEPHAHFPAFQPSAGLLGNTGFSAADGDSTLVGGWYDANDLPRAARDQLLHQFFNNMRLLGKAINIPRFMASLDMPASKRPHPCLVYAMYALVARSSPSPKLRKLEEHFAEIAATQLQQSVKSVDRIFDAVRASNIMALYYFSKAQYHLGTMMTNQASRLAIACGLHQIASSTWRPNNRPTDAVNNRLMSMMRRRGFLIPPARDATEHGERIWAFWNVYLIDRTGSIAAQWPPNIRDEDVCTPFPKPLHEYELGLVSSRDDYSLASLYDDGPPQVLPYNTESSGTILYMKALALLAQASKLLYLPAEKKRSSSLSSSDGSSISPPDIDEYLRQQSYYASRPPTAEGPAENRHNTRTPSIRTPRAFERCRFALTRLESELPPDLRTAWGTWDGMAPQWVFQNPQKITMTLHFLLGCSWMLMFDTCSYTAENTQAVACAQRMAHTLRALLPDRLQLELEAFMVMCFSLVSMILIREVKRLQALGDHVSANNLHDDFNIVLAAMKVPSKNEHVINKDQINRAETIRNASLHETEFMRDRDDTDPDRLHDEPSPTGGLPQPFPHHA